MSDPRLEKLKGFRYKPNLITCICSDRLEIEYWWEESNFVRIHLNENYSMCHISVTDKGYLIHSETISMTNKTGMDKIELIMDRYLC